MWGAALNNSRQHEVKANTVSSVSVCHCHKGELWDVETPRIQNCRSFLGGRLWCVNVAKLWLASLLTFETITETDHMTPRGWNAFKHCWNFIPLKLNSATTNHSCIDKHHPKAFFLNRHEQKNTAFFFARVEDTLTHWQPTRQSQWCMPSAWNPMTSVVIRRLLVPLVLHPAWPLKSWCLHLRIAWSWDLLTINYCIWLNLQVFHFIWCRGCGCFENSGWAAGVSHTQSFQVFADVWPGKQ